MAALSPSAPKKTKAKASPRRAAVPVEMVDLVRRHYLAQRAMNAQKKIAEKAREELLALLEDAKVSELDLEIFDDAGNVVGLDVWVETPVVEYIDVPTLGELRDAGEISEEQYVAMLSSTKKAVIEHAGEAIAVRATFKKLGTRNVFVKVAG